MTWIKHQTRLALDDQFRNSRHAAGDGRHVQCQRFHQHNRQTFHKTWQYQYVGSSNRFERA